MFWRSLNRAPWLDRSLPDFNSARWIVLVLCLGAAASFLLAQQAPPPQAAAAPANRQARPRAGTAPAQPAEANPAAQPSQAPSQGAGPNAPQTQQAQPGNQPSPQKAPDGAQSGSSQTPKETPKTSTDATILSWLRLTEDELHMPKAAYAGLLLLLGAVGGLITAFYSIGEALPGIGGGGLVQPQVARMQAFENASKTCADRLAELQDKLKTANSHDPTVENLRYLATQYVEEMKLYEKHVSRLRDLVNKNRWRIWAYGLPMYIIIGGATSLLFARDWLQALLFGYSWSGVISTIGLKGTVAQKDTTASQQGQQMIDEIQRLKQEKRALETRTELATQVLALAVQQIQPPPTQPPPLPAPPPNK